MQLLREEEYQHQLQDLLLRENDEAEHGFVIRASDLLAHAPSLGDRLLWAMKDVLTLVKTAVIESERNMMASDGSESEEVREIVSRMRIKQRVHVRIARLPCTEEFCRPSVSAIRSTDDGRFVQVRGTVIRTGAPRMLEWKAIYECSDPKCGFRFPVTAEVEYDNLAELPAVCPSDRCKSRDFRVLEDTIERIDHQEIRIQEHVQSLGVGSLPRSISIVLQHDMVGVCKAGDEVVVTAVVARRWTRISRGARCDLEVVLKANHVQIVSGDGDRVERSLPEDVVRDFTEFWEYFRSEGRPMAARDVIIRSVCPDLHGMATVKLAVAMALAGGVGWTDPQSGARARGESHLLLVGDPGTGKSQCLRWATKVHPRAVLTTGVGTTSAGLTCVATRDSGEWVLEAGALVLADRGICCIDEFSQIQERDRAAIHEAMEQQSISVAKAGIVSRLNSRCTVLAASNPKGTYDPDADLTTNTAIGGPLLSRFDLVLVILDRADPRWDKRVATFLLKRACGGARAPATGELADFAPSPDVAGGTVLPVGSRTPAPAAAAASSSASMRGGRKRPEDVWVDAEPSRIVRGLDRSIRKAKVPAKSVPLWSVDRWRAYLQYIRGVYQPVLSRPAEELLATYYRRQRASDTRSQARTTLRLLESLVRLAQAHARICCSSTVHLADAAAAIALMESSVSLTGAFGSETGGVSNTMADFPDDPDAAHTALTEQVLNGLGLSRLIEEEQRLELEQEEGHENGSDTGGGSDRGPQSPRSPGTQQSRIIRGTSDAIAEARERLAAARNHVDAGAHIPRSRRFYPDSRVASQLTATQSPLRPPQPRAAPRPPPPIDEDEEEDDDESYLLSMERRRRERQKNGEEPTIMNITRPTGGQIRQQILQNDTLQRPPPPPAPQPAIPPRHPSSSSSAGSKRARQDDIMASLFDGEEQDPLSPKRRNTGQDDTADDLDLPDDDF